MKVIVTGSTGTAGAEVLRRALADDKIEQVLSITRRPTGVKHHKLVSIIHEDFSNLSSISAEFRGYNACLWCLGISQSAVDRETYRRITFDWTLEGASVMGTVNSKFTFCFLSGQGADSREQSRILFARVKGQTENALLELGHPRVFCFRPGYIHSETAPPKGRFEKYIMKPIAPFLARISNKMSVEATDLARAMIRVARDGHAQSIIENAEIRKLAI